MTKDEFDEIKKEVTELFVEFARGEIGNTSTRFAMDGLLFNLMKVWTIHKPKEEVMVDDKIS